MAPAAAQSQERLGEKDRALISSPESRVCRGLASSLPKSHSLAVPSRPPEAQSDPSGETVTGFWAKGEERTHETHSVWPCSWMVYLQIPKVFHSLMVRSRATERTSLVWPMKRRVVLPEAKSHRRRVPSHEPDRQ